MKEAVSRNRDLPVIGWREWLALPDLGIEIVKAKVDTGARSSALHAYDYRPFRRGGRPFIRFKVHPVQRDASDSVEAEAEVIDERYVRNSGGGQELRWVVRTNVEMMGLKFPIEVTLTRRDAMGFRMLLGREAIRNRFVVDPGRSYLASARHRRSRKAN